MKDPIYEPRGEARDYADLALNIYTGCTHRCSYCYAPGILRMRREAFSQHVAPREGIVDAVRRQLSHGGFEGRTVHLCFTCDPYPNGVNVEPTREIIKAIHQAGAFVQILTKNGTAASSDFDLLDEFDSFGVTYTGADPGDEPGCDPADMRLRALRWAHDLGIRTWVSCEPVMDAHAIYRLICEADYVDMFRIGKLNHMASDIDWAAFGRNVELVCQHMGRAYELKGSLRREMGR